MADDLPFRTSTHTREEAEEMAMLANLFSAATQPYFAASADHRQAVSMMMAALPMYAGHLFASLMFAGDVDQKHQARMAKSAAHNFREGVKVGLKVNARHAKETGMMGGVQ